MQMLNPQQLVMVVFFLESQATVAAGMWTRLVQVDVDLWVAKVFIAASAEHDTFLAFDDRLLCDQINRPILVDDLGGVCEANISIIVFVVSLRRCKQNVIQSDYNNNELIFLTCPVCVTSLPSSALRKAPATWVVIDLALRQ